LLKSGSWCLGWPPSKRFTLQEIQQNNLISKGTRVNKSELIDAIAASADIPKAVAGRALDAVIESVTGALKAGDSVVLVGFGTFAVKDRAARTGRNPQTGNPISIAAAKIPGFKAGKALKDAVN
jgi:DNA-binding protein HU-beta